MLANITRRIALHHGSRRLLGLAAAVALLGALSIGVAQVPTASAQGHWWHHDRDDYSYTYPVTYSYTSYPVYSYSTPVYSYSYPVYTYSSPDYDDYSYSYPTYYTTPYYYSVYNSYSNPCVFWGYVC